MMMIMVINKIYSNFFSEFACYATRKDRSATLFSPLVFRVMQGAYFVTTGYQKSYYQVIFGKTGLFVKVMDSQI